LYCEVVGDIVHTVIETDTVFCHVVAEENYARHSQRRLPANLSNETAGHALALADAAKGKPTES